MDPLTILTAVTTAIKVAQMAIDAGKSAKPIFDAILDRIHGKPPAAVMPADLDALAAASDLVTANIMRPLDAD